MNGTFESGELAEGEVVIDVLEVDMPLPPGKRLNLTQMFLNSFGKFMLPSLKQWDAFERMKRRVAANPDGELRLKNTAPEPSQEKTREVNHV